MTGAHGGGEGCGMGLKYVGGMREWLKVCEGEGDLGEAIWRIRDRLGRRSYMATREDR